MDASRYRVAAEGPLRYLLALPQAPAVARPPMLCFLHGYDEGAPTDLEEALTRHWPLRSGPAVRVLEPFIIVAPQLPTRGDLWHRYADAVRVILRHVQQRHNGDPQRTYLTGFSFGGNGVFDLALAQPDFWATLWLVDPTRVLTQPIALLIWLSIGELARYQARAFLQRRGLEAIDSAPTSDRVWCDDGADHGAPRLGCIAMHVCTSGC